MAGFLGFGRSFFVEKKVPVFFKGNKWVFSKNMDTPKWMVKMMENLIKMDDLGVPPFTETPKWG